MSPLIKRMVSVSYLMFPGAFPLAVLVLTTVACTPDWRESPLEYSSGVGS
jgi:hypothetical protein